MNSSKIYEILHIAELIEKIFQRDLAQKIRPSTRNSNFLSQDRVLTIKLKKRVSRCSWEIGQRPGIDMFPISHQIKIEQNNQ